MGRSRSPGPVRYSGNTSTTRRSRAGLNPWISIDPSANGEPGSPPDFSDDANLPVPGVWYRYDPNSTMDDNPSSAGQYVKADDTGLYFWLKSDGVEAANGSNNYEWDTVDNTAGRFATPLIGPNGSPVKWDDNFGIELLCIQAGNTPANGQMAGVAFGISTDNILTSTTDNAVDNFFNATWHKQAAGSAGLVFRGGAPASQTTVSGGNLCVATHVALPHLLTDDNQTAGTKVAPGYGIKMALDASHRMIVRTTFGNMSEGIDPDYSSDPMVNSQVMLFVAPCWQIEDSVLNSAITDDPVVALSGWKLFYRLSMYGEKYNPTFVPGRKNIYGGIGKAGY
jgi:hypothetical protein